ncbi:MAG: hypothetical protein CME63_15175 [Halobacteriovoraceae bacterium]|nr:hypothetical protein [Halobacteriovoraceae bacterium]|tara:strand:+ start:139085 stop:139687 length:603 start_codon:yes stop_codon:yes gene_type:complete
MRDLKIKKIKLFVLILLLLSSCAGEKVKVTTFPDKATVSIQEKNGQIVDLGVTPIELNSSDVFQSQNMAQVILSKDGYLSERLYLSRSDIPTEVSVSQKLKREDVSDQAALNSRILHSVASKIAEAQRNSFNKNYIKAELLLKQILEDYPELGVGHDLLANIYYLTNSKSKALFHYRKAKQFSDDSVKRDQMIKILEREI